MTLEEKKILAIDPGREKLGLAVMDSDGEVIEKRVIARDKFSDILSELVNRHHPGIFAIGDGTGSGWVLDVVHALGQGEVRKIKEGGSTLEARDLAWKINPPGGIWRFLPRILWPDPQELDAWAAVVIGRRAIGE